jgi:hypothetical protein
MNKEMIKTIALRFIRAFAAGSVASMVAILASAQLNADVLKDPHTIIYSLLLGALSGGLQAIDKLLRYQDAPQ